MIAGMLDKRAQVVERVKQADGQGSWFYIDQVVASLWVAIQPLSSRERMQLAQFGTEVDVKIYARPHAALKRDSVLVYQGRRLQIVDVLNPSEQSYYVEVLAKEVRP